MTKKSPLRALRTLSRIMTLGVIGLVVYVLMHFLPGGWGTGQGPGEGGRVQQDGATDGTADAPDTPRETQVTTDGSSPDILNALHDRTAEDGVVEGGLSDDEPSNDPRTVTGPERAALASGILTILIDEHNYFLAIPDGNDWRYSPITLARARDLSTRAAGDSNGIRVRILRRSTSRASAEHRLMNELQDAGLEPDAIFMSSQLEPAN